MNQATVDSINLYFVNLEQEVGLCNVVKTAVDMGMTRADGTSLMKYDKALGGNGLPAYDYSSFTLGSVYVSPMSMAAAYASVAARGWYCSPQAILKIDGHRVRQAAARAGSELPPGHVHRVLPTPPTTSCKGVLTVPGATAAGRGIPGHTAAAKTGTANAGYYAAFAGYTPTLAGLRVRLQSEEPDRRRRDARLQLLLPRPVRRELPWSDVRRQRTRRHVGGDVPACGTRPGRRLRQSARLSFFSLGTGLGAPKIVGKKKPPKKGGGPGGPGPAPAARRRRSIATWPAVPVTTWPDPDLRAVASCRAGCAREQPRGCPRPGPRRAASGPS